MPRKFLLLSSKILQFHLERDFLDSFLAQSFAMPAHRAINDGPVRRHKRLKELWARVYQLRKPYFGNSFSEFERLQYYMKMKKNERKASFP